MANSILRAVACRDAPSHSPKTATSGESCFLRSVLSLPGSRTRARAVGQADLYSILNIPAVCVLSGPDVAVTDRTPESPTVCFCMF